MSTIESITIRAYGILLDAEARRLLVSDENIRGQLFTKFPGGGLELGEGLKDCLVREFQEELGIDVTIGAHIYTTDYFQPSLFLDTQQFIGIYYYVELADKNQQIPLASTEKDGGNGEKIEGFRWIDMTKLTVDTVTLPTDKIVVQLLLDQR